MSGSLFPTLPGLTFPVVREPKWNTGFQKALSGKRSTIAYQVYPLIHFELVFSALRDSLSPSELKSLKGLFGSLLGRFDSFLFQDPDFNSVTAQAFGTSTGSTATTYQLIASYGNVGGPQYNEIVQNLNGTPSLYDNGTLISAANYVIGPTGIVQFSTSPASGHALTWTGSFYYRCGFDEDSIPWTKFMNKLWEAKSVKFTSIIL